MAIGRLIGFAVFLLIVFIINPAGADDSENPRKSDPVKINGAFQASSMSYSSSGIDRRQEPFSWILNGQLTVLIHDISFPFSATISEKDRSFRQPFNEYGVSPRYKWVTAHAGYRSMNLSRFTLSGAKFLGAGIELIPRRFRFAAMYGRFQRAIELDTSATYVATPAYKRVGHAVKIGFGSSQSYFDFIYFKAADDTSSLEDPASRNAVLPVENLCIGISTRASLSANIRIEGDFGISAFSRDTRSAEIENSNNNALKLFKSFFTPRSSSSARFAGAASLDYSSSVFGSNIRYERIEADYQSLGAYYFDSDIESIAISPRLNLLNRRLRISLTGGTRRDNLDNSKRNTTVRSIVSTAVSWSPNMQFSVSLQIGNYNINQKEGREEVVDSIRVKNVSRNISISPMYTIKVADRVHSSGINFNYQQYSDKNEFNQTDNDLKAYTVNLTHSVTFTDRGLTAAGSVNFTKSKSSENTTNLSGFNMSLSKNLLENKMTLQGSAGYSSTKYTAPGNSSVVNINSGLNYRPRPDLAMMLNISFLINSTSLVNGTDFNETRINMNISRRFSF